VETFRLPTLYVFFFIQIGTRRLHLAGITAHPTAAWVNQPARNFLWQLEESGYPARCLIRDRASKYVHVFEIKGIDVIKTPVRAPKANAFAERWIRCVREECLDRLIVLDQGHLHYVLNKYLDYNCGRPHQGIEQRTPIPLPISNPQGQSERRAIMHGLIHDNRRVASLSRADTVFAPYRFFATTQLTNRTHDLYVRPRALWTLRCYPSRSRRRMAAACRWASMPSKLDCATVWRANSCEPGWATSMCVITLRNMPTHRPPV